MGSHIIQLLAVPVLAPVSSVFLAANLISNTMSKSSDGEKASTEHVTPGGLVRYQVTVHLRDMRANTNPRRPR